MGKVGNAKVLDLSDDFNDYILLRASQHGLAERLESFFDGGMFCP